MNESDSHTEWCNLHARNTPCAILTTRKVNQVGLLYAADSPEGDVLSHRATELYDFWSGNLFGHPLTVGIESAARRAHPGLARLRTGINIPDGCPKGPRRYLLQRRALQLLCVSSLIAAFGCSAADKAPESVVEARGLKIAVRPVCSESVMQLHFSAENISSKVIVLESGIPPWDYGPRGTSFSAKAGRESLKLDPVFIPFGRTGPIRFESGEEKEGWVPVVRLFPDILEKLKSTAVSVHWSYKADRESGPIAGTLEIVRNPCPQ